MSAGVGAANIQELATVDMHTAGEPVRIVVEGYPSLRGETLLEQRRDASTRFDHLRTALCLSPAGMAGCTA
jgi:trans-L-3-hydroxyproline dehydratase